MKLIGIFFFFYIFWKGLNENIGWMFWTGLIMMLVMLMWQLFSVWTTVAMFF